MRPCPACRSRGPHREHHVPACRYGPGPEVPYRECGECGSLFIVRIPPDLGQEYGPGYHFLDRRGLRARLRRLRNRHAVTGRGLVGSWLTRLFPPPLEGFPEVLQAAGAGPEAAGSVRILDVGTGDAEILFRLRDAGYQHLVGVDPYLPDGLEGSGVRLIRGTLEEMAGAHPGAAPPDPFDLVMFHHSLEHVPDPEAALRAARGLLSPRGRILVRLPVVPCLAWERYGVHWVQIDAPRHLTVFSRTGLPLLAGRAGLDMELVRDDSTEVQFLGSELYREGRPLTELYSRYGWAERRRRRRQARKLNREGRGDQAAFVFRAAGSGQAGPAPL